MLDVPYESFLLLPRLILLRPCAEGNGLRPLAVALQTLHVLGEQRLCVPAERGEKGRLLDGDWTVKRVL